MRCKPSRQKNIRQYGDGDGEENDDGNTQGECTLLSLCVAVGVGFDSLARLNKENNYKTIGDCTNKSF
jgi:hypothetical protein